MNKSDFIFLIDKLNFVYVYNIEDEKDKGFIY